MSRCHHRFKLATEVASQSGAGTQGELDLREPVGFYEVDRFAEVLKIDPISIRISVGTAASHAINAVERRRADRQRAAEGRHILKDVLPQALHFVELISSIGEQELRRITLPRDGIDATSAIDEAVRHASLCGKALRDILDQRDYVKLPGGIADVDRLCISLIERLEMVWSRWTGKPAPCGATGPFVSFVAAAWEDLGFQDFVDRDGNPRTAVDAIGSRIASRGRRTFSSKKNGEGSLRPSARLRDGASSKQG